MKTTLQATLVAICALSMATVQAQVPSDYVALPDNITSISQLPPEVQGSAVVSNGHVYVDKQYYQTVNQAGLNQYGVAAGSTTAAGGAAAGSTAIIVAVGAGLFAVIGAVVAGSVSNTTTASTPASHK